MSQETAQGDDQAGFASPAGDVPLAPSCAPLSSRSESQLLRRRNASPGTVGFSVGLAGGVASGDLIFGLNGDRARSLLPSVLDRLGAGGCHSATGPCARPEADVRPSSEPDRRKGVDLGRLRERDGIGDSDRADGSELDAGAGAGTAAGAAEVDADVWSLGRVGIGAVTERFFLAWRRSAMR